MVQKHTDLQIIEAFRAGGHARERTWEFIYKEWRDKVIAFIISKGGTPDETLEALNIAAMSFQLRICNPDFVLKSKLSTYFITCIYHEWLRMKKREGKTTIAELEEKHISDFVESVDAEIAKAEFIKAVQESLNRIGERCKTILLLFTNGFSMKEIAEKMNFPGGEQVAKNEKMKCQTKYETFLREHPHILQHIQNLRNG